MLEKSNSELERKGEIYADTPATSTETVNDIGMGKYQWWLFAVAGFGWFAYVIKSASAPGES
ncbi:hypothetical protein C8Q74DRAFT_1373859 [Fomes fomentarius]|nr:hypothetical protein C8Q74DRAFT_1373855 [Fomes fomentarius]KAI0752055.1 hypothetical protein C8Q74DRAFT_1373859 [Fomes fomentarius]